MPTPEGWRAIPALLAAAEERSAALAAELDERAAKVFQRGDGEGFRDDDQWAKHALRAHLWDVLDRLAACPLVPGPEEGDVVADREFAGDLARRHGGPFVAAFLDTAPAVRFLAQRNPALADWLAVADAPTLAPPIRRSCRSTLYDEPDDEYGIQFQCDAAAGSAPPITSAQ